MYLCKQQPILIMTMASSCYGGVMSPIMLCIYLDGLLNLLATAQIGWFISRVFVGCLVNADDIVLLTPTTGAMRNMLGICDSFAKDYNLVFNANKSKWLMFGHTGHCFNKVDFHVGGNIIEQVYEWPHLGHIISDECNDASDILNRKHFCPDRLIMLFVTSVIETPLLSSR